MKQVIVVYGPTGCGKTRLSIEIAHQVGGEIISADSRQIYRGLDIGTGKVRPEEMRWIPHWWLDLVDPDTVFSAALFRDYAREKIGEIQARGNVPILCGGTGLYIDAVIYDLDVPSFQSDPNYQSDLEKFRLEHGNLALWERLAKVDPEYAKELHPNSFPFVMRGLEIMERTGKSKKDFHVWPTAWRTLKYDVRAVTPYDGDRAKLYERINARVLEMFDQGLVEETASLLATWYSSDGPGLSTIGYKESIQLLNGELPLQTAKEMVQQGNRNYAKRQITWCRKYAVLARWE